MTIIISNLPTMTVICTTVYQFIVLSNPPCWRRHAKKDFSSNVCGQNFRWHPWWWQDGDQGSANSIAVAVATRERPREAGAQGCTRTHARWHARTTARVTYTTDVRVARQFQTLHWFSFKQCQKVKSQICQRVARTLHR